MSTVRGLVESLAKKIGDNKAILEGLVGPPDPVDEKEGIQLAPPAVLLVADRLVYVNAQVDQLSELMKRLQGQFVDEGGK